MALLFANHTAIVYPAVETPDATSKVVPVPSEGASVTLTCQIAPIRNEATFDAQTGVELINPHRLSCEPEDVESLPYGARVVWEDTGYEFRITKAGELFAADGDFEELNFGRCEMEKLEITA